MPICENQLFKAKKYSTVECTSKFPIHVNNLRKSNKASSKECRPKDNDFYSLITFYDSIPGWCYSIIPQLQPITIFLSFKIIETSTTYQSTNFKTICWCWNKGNVKYSHTKVIDYHSSKKFLTFDVILYLFPAAKIRISILTLPDWSRKTMKLITVWIIAWEISQWYK